MNFNTARGALLCLVAILMLGMSEERSGPERPSDDQLVQWVREALANDPRIDATDVQIRVEDGVVDLAGRVPTLAGRKYAILDAQRLLGVVAVLDRLEVASLEVGDERLARDVKRRIASSSSVESRDLAISASDGEVTLGGQVGSWAEFWQAELLASQVRGVRSIENRLEVEAQQTRDDAAVTRDVKSTLERDEYLTGLRIDVSAKAGAVTLAGTVSSAFEKARAGDAARWVPGVARIDNRLRVSWQQGRSERVTPPVPRSDEELERAIVAAFSQDDRVDATHVVVEVEDGLATLSGRVTHAHEARLLGQDARNVVGVAWVSNNVEVVPPKRRDQVIAMDVEEILAVDSALYEFSIQPIVEDGVVTLTGVVPSRFHQEHAGAVVSRVLGVKRVENEIQIVRKQVSDDEKLANAIRKRLARDAVTAGLLARIHVDVKAGIATLSGDVDTIAERRAAERIVARTPGVKKVENHLVVDPYPFPWEDPPSLPGSPYESDYPILPWVADSGSLQRYALL